MALPTIGPLKAMVSTPGMLPWVNLVVGKALERSLHSSMLFAWCVNIAAYFVYLPIWILNLMPSPILLFSSSADQVFERASPRRWLWEHAAFLGVSHLNWVRRSWKLWMYGPQQRRPWKILFTLRNCQKNWSDSMLRPSKRRCTSSLPAALHLLPLPLIKYYHCHRLLSSSTAQNPPPDDYHHLLRDQFTCLRTMANVIPMHTGR